ncbi:MAG: CD225/dispanin family protein, partial [Acidobacteriota bacterium]
AAGPPPAAAPPPVQVAPQSTAPMPAAPPPPTPVAPPPPVAGQAPPAADYAPPVAGQAPPVASSYPQATYQPPSQVGYPAGQALHQAPVDAAPIPNYLPWAIIATLLCCMPAGVVGIIYASKANALKTAGNYVEARHKADIARNWLLASVGVALMAFVLVFFANLADGAVPM